MSISSDEFSDFKQLADGIFKANFLFIKAEGSAIFKLILYFSYSRPLSFILRYKYPLESMPNISWILIINLSLLSV